MRSQLEGLQERKRTGQVLVQDAKCGAAGRVGALLAVLTLGQRGGSHRSIPGVRHYARFVCVVSRGIPISSCWAPPDRTNWRSASRQRRMNRSATNSSACITIAVEPFQVPIFRHGLPVLAGLCSTWISIRESDLWLSTPACHGGSAHRGPTTRRRPRRFPCSRVYFGSAQPRQTRAQQERLASLSLRVCRRCRDPGIRRSHRRACASRRRGQHSFGHATIFRQDPYRASAMCGIPLCPQFSNLLKHLCPRERAKD